MRIALIAVLVVPLTFGCDASTSSSPIGRQAGRAEVQLLDAKVVPFKNAENGKMGQEVLTTWKNVGEIPVRVVDAEITSLSEDGTPRQSFNYTLYADFDDAPGVRPGETHETNPGNGFKLPGFEGLPGFVPAASVKVRITKVSAASGM